ERDHPVPRHPRDHRTVAPRARSRLEVGPGARGVRRRAGGPTVRDRVRRVLRDVGVRRCRQRHRRARADPRRPGRRPGGRGDRSGEHVRRYRRGHLCERCATPVRRCAPDHVAGRSGRGPRRHRPRDGRRDRGPPLWADGRHAAPRRPGRPPRARPRGGRGTGARRTLRGGPGRLGHRRVVQLLPREEPRGAGRRGRGGHRR
ncbi:MAG: hypothetical protein AVDCRST_MAG54-823, partial [uncultured Actinomycetospora sp.]